MESALAWVGWIAEWVTRLIPKREILDTTEGAIKYVRGREPKVCGPGIHWWWPWTSTWVPYPTARQTDRLETQSMETKDGKTFLVSGTLTYAVDDLLALVSTTHSPSTAVLEIAGAALHDVLADYDWSELQSMQRKGTLKTQLRNAAQKELAEYGVKVIRLKLNTLARCRVLKISQSTASEEN